MAVICAQVYVYVCHSTRTSDACHTSSKRWSTAHSSMCSTLSLLNVEWKLCAHTKSDVQTSKLTQRYTILACCWYQSCENCWFVIFQLFFLKYLCKLKKQYLHQFLSLDVFYFLSFGYRVETVRTHYKRRTNIKTYTTLYYISVLLVSVVWILLICHFPTVFPRNIWWKLTKQYLHQFLSLHKYFIIVRFWCWKQPKNTTDALLFLLYAICLHYLHVVHHGNCLCRCVYTCVTVLASIVISFWAFTKMFS